MNGGIHLAATARRVIECGRKQPSDYPLPRAASGVPWCSVNAVLCCHPAWRDWQAHKPMSQIIPVMCWLAGEP